jgi:magnesium transporter
MRTLIVCQNGDFQQHLPPEAISDELTRPGSVIWLDIRDPNEDDTALLQEEFGFHPLVVEDAVGKQQRPIIRAHNGYYFLVFYAAHYNRQLLDVKLQAISLFIGRNYLISVHYGYIQRIDITAQRWKEPYTGVESNIGSLVYALLDGIVDDYFPIMDTMGEQIDHIEERLFTRFREDRLPRILAMKRELLYLRRVVGPQRDIVNTLMRREVYATNDKDAIYFQDLHDHLMRVSDQIDVYRDLLSHVQETYLSQQSNRLNETVKVLTLSSIILMVDALIAGIYGMNFEYMPELAWPLGYPFAIGLMIIIDIGLFLFFRRRNWI